MRDLTEIEDEYESAVESLLEEYKQKVSEGQDKSKLRELFDKKLNVLIEKRKKECEKYILSHKQEMLGEEEKPKKKKEKDTGPFKAKHFSFKKTPKERFIHFTKFHYFKSAIYIRNFWHNWAPSWLKFSFYRVWDLIRSFMFDVTTFIKHIIENIKKFFLKQFERLKAILAKLFEILKKGYTFLSGKFKTFKEKFKKKKKEGESEAKQGEEPKQEGGEEKEGEKPAEEPNKAQEEEPQEESSEPKTE